MTSKELVIETLEFSGPDRIPRQLWTLPWAEIHYPIELKKIKNDFPDDIVNAPSVYKQKPLTKGQRFEIGTYTDEWGCEFETRERGVLGEVKKPLIKNWEAIEKIKIPYEMLSIDAGQINASCRNTDKFVIADDKVRPFERIQWLRGTENVYIDIAAESEGFQKLLNIIHEFNLKELDVWAHTDVDALYVSDDWGSQNTMLISPEMWRRKFKHMYKEYVDLAHSRDKYLFMHSDGNIFDIFSDLVEIGVDAINCEQFLIGVNKLGCRFKGKITFWGGIDSQHLLCEAIQQDVEKAVSLVGQELYEHGGVIGQCEFGHGGKPDNVYAVFKAWQNI